MLENKNFLGIDFGLKRTGIATSHFQDRIAFGQEPIVTTDENTLISKLTQVIATHNIGTIVIGMPLGLQEKDTQMSKKVRSFIKKLTEHLDKNIAIVEWNEVLTSKIASTNLKMTKNKSSIDSESARIILQEFLDFQNENKTTGTKRN